MHLQNFIMKVVKCFLGIRQTADFLPIHMSQSSAEFFFISGIIPSHYEIVIGCICDILATKVWDEGWSRSQTLSI